MSLFVDKLADLEIMKDFDSSFCGLNSIMFYGSNGKAQPLYSKIYTPTGYTTMGEIRIGDEVFSMNGITKVSNIFPQGIQKTYRVWFSDGRFTDCAEDHLWLINTEKKRMGRTSKLFEEVISTKEMLDKVIIKYGNRDRYNYKIPLSEVNFIEKKVNIPPYLLGVLLGDGSLSFSKITLSNSEDDIVKKCLKILETLDATFTTHDNDHSIKGAYKKLRGYLQECGLIGVYSHTKFIPKDYLYNTKENRVELLRGLIDTDGTINKNTRNINYYTTSKQLKDDVCFLVRSLGGRCFVCEDKEPKYKHKGEIKTGKLCYSLSISFENLLPFSSDKHTSRYKENKRVRDGLYINKIEYIGDIECQCIMVEDDSHTYITDEFIVTHNSSITGALSKFLNEPVIELSPKGDNNFKDEFPKLLSIPICNLKELRDIASQFEVESTRIRKIYIANAKKDTALIESYKKSLGAEYDKLKVFADKKKYPVAAIAVSEYSTINSWIEDEVAEKMNLNVVGDKDNKTIGSDWSHYKKEVMDLFSSLRRLPMLTIFNTGELLADDKKDLSQTIPNIASGQSQRLIIDGLSAMFRVGLDKEGKHKVWLIDSAKTKPYIKNVYSKTEIAKDLNVSGKPETFWEYLTKVRNEK